MNRWIALSPTLLAAIVAIGAGESPAQAAAAPACVVMNADRLPLSERVSPLDSVSFTVAGAPVKICYGRPSARGRTMIGGPSVPYGQLWRTGANEPTMIHTTISLVVAGMRIEPGSYSVYTVPGQGQWQLILNRSISQWGHESNYTPEVREAEVGRASVPSERLGSHVEQFAIRAQHANPDHVVIYLEWERTQVRIPVGRG